MIPMEFGGRRPRRLARNKPASCQPVTRRRSHRQARASLIAASLVLTACADAGASDPSSTAERQSPPTASDTATVDLDSASTSAAPSPPVPATAPMTTALATSTTITAVVTTTTSTTSTSTTPSTSTTIADPLAGTFDRACVRQAGPLGSLEKLATELAGVVDLTGLWAENGFVDRVAPGGLVDVCANNGLDDITGEGRPIVDDATLDAARRANVERQQAKINELFAPYGTAPIAVDGDSGPITGQRLCAARLALGLPASVSDMQAGSDEQAALVATSQLATPTSSAIGSERWALIDRTCQVMFVGSGANTVFIFPASTGSEGFETRLQDRAEVFRFDPAIDNGGWHDSSEFPVGVDNPLNGNMFKPLYFDFGQAIHGANSVPPTPQSKGCVRLSVADQTTLLAWLGLDGLREETWRKSEINLTVNVQGQFVGR